jgi:predicted phosphoribosyltransferase
VRFHDRHDAGTRLAAAVAELDLDRPIVLALPRGGVPVAAPVAARLDAPLAALVACKVGARFQPELGVGAVSEDGVVVWTTGSESEDREALTAARDEVARRVARFRGGRPLPELRGRHVVLVDDGLATGVSAEAALRCVRLHGPARLVLAVPVGAPDTVARLTGPELADQVVCLHAPPSFDAVGRWYADFHQTGDEEVNRLLDLQV